MGQKDIVKFTKEDEYILKAIFVLLMLICNLFGYPERLGVTYRSIFSAGAVPIEMILAGFGEIHITLFAFLAGHGAYTLCRGKNPREMFGVLGMRIGALYRQYWTVFAVFIPLCVIRHIRRVTVDFWGLFWNLTGMQPFYNGEWWFFAPLVLILFFYPVLHQFSERFRSPASELAAVVLCNAFCIHVLPVWVEGMWEPTLKGSFGYEKIFEVALLLPAFWMGCIFAKHDFLSKIKLRLSGNYMYCIGAAIFAVGSIPLRMYIGSEFDYLMVPLYGASIFVALNGKWGAGIRRGLAYIGKEAVFIWLTHSMFCYELCQSVIYAPKYSVLVLLWLLVVCMITAKVLRMGMRILGKCWSAAIGRFSFENPG